MFTKIEFENFRVLRDAVLPLEPFTLLIGPNGSGKSTVLDALLFLANRQVRHVEVASVAARGARTRIAPYWESRGHLLRCDVTWERSPDHPQQRSANVAVENRPAFTAATPFDSGPLPVEVFNLEPSALRAPSQLQPHGRLAPNGAWLAGALDALRDEYPEHFEDLNREISVWLPEFDRVLFETPGAGQRSVLLRTKVGGHSIPAARLSQGTLIALAIMTLAWTPTALQIIGLEEPDRGLHPRLLREVRDALYRLAYPQEFGLSRAPAQVIATTHSPIFLDLVKDRPAQVVLCDKHDLAATFSRLADRADLAELLEDTSLSELWYSGVLGGVPDGS